MGNRLSHQRKGYSPLPIKDGLNPTRVRVPEDITQIVAFDFLEQVIMSQRHRHPLDNADALLERFKANEVVIFDATPISPETILRANQDVFFYRTPAPEEPVPYDIHIVYEDDDIIVVDKPPFMATMPRARHITETATVRLRRSTGIDELSPAHRLDRLTSGLLLFTKHRGVRGSYQTLFARREVSKTYIAIAEYAHFTTPLTWASRMEKTPGEIQGRIEEGEHNAITQLADVTPLTHDEQQKLEAIHGEQKPLARYTLKPQTGKTHQLRLHMWAAGVPILGDPVYPVIHPVDAEDMNIPMHLTAAVLGFTDPISGQEREFRTTLDF
ncbi:pseudouridine synthase [Corynebacterium sp. L4756]|uniref:pseudouridine synthase n=1 Tax=unclassified Corynebacterium TaxID=2624378 RepID=UPI00374DC4A9